MSLPALQPVAMRLQFLDISNSHLYNSAAGFLSVGWTALKSLSLDASRAMDDVLTGLNHPALESLDIKEFAWLNGFRFNKLQPDQIHCPQLTSLAFEFDSRQEAPASEGGRECCSFVHLPRLATLDLKLLLVYNQLTRMDLGLPASLEHLTVRSSGAIGVDLN